MIESDNGETLKLVLGVIVRKRSHRSYCVNVFDEKVEGGDRSE